MKIHVYEEIDCMFIPGLKFFLKHKIDQTEKNIMVFVIENIFLPYCRYGQTDETI